MPRKKIGIIVPSTNTTGEADFWRVVPREITVHSARMWGLTATAEAVEGMNKDVEKAAGLLATAGVDVVAYVCTGGSFFMGSGYDQELIKRMAKAAGVPAVATSPAAVEALRALGIKKVSVATPYPEDLNRRLRAYLEAYGFEVVRLVGKGLGATTNLEIGNQTPDDVYEFALKNWDPRADGMFLSCTDWKSVEAVERIEQKIGKPVVTANQATIWATLRKLDVKEPIRGYGRLMRTLAAAPV